MYIINVYHVEDSDGQKAMTNNYHVECIGSCRTLYHTYSMYWYILTVVYRPTLTV